MPYRRRIRKMTRGKGHSTHTKTALFTHGPGTIPSVTRIVETEGGLRTTNGGVQTFADNRVTDETCNIGDLIKYINVFIQSGPRNGASVTETGWLEYAVICGKESDVAIPITNMGTETLGVVANRMFPAECLLSGSFPVSIYNSNSINLQIKVPKKCQFLRMGDKIDVVVYHRTTSATDTGTANVRTVVSTIYKAYY